MRFVGRLLMTIFLIGGASLAVAQEPTPVGHPSSSGFLPTRLQRLTPDLSGLCRSRRIAGAVLLIARGDKIAYLRRSPFQDREGDTMQTVPSSASPR